MASSPDFGTTLNVTNLGDEWFRRERGPRNQNVAGKGYQPSFADLGIHVDLRDEQISQPLGQFLLCGTIHTCED